MNIPTICDCFVCGNYLHLSTRYGDRGTWKQKNKEKQLYSDEKAKKGTLGEIEKSLGSPILFSTTNLPLPPFSSVSLAVSECLCVQTFYDHINYEWNNGI